MRKAVCSSCLEDIRWVKELKEYNLCAWLALREWKDIYKKSEAREKKRYDELRKFNIAVYIRGKDGGKSYFESELIRFLLEKNIKVQHTREEEIRSAVAGDRHVKDLLIICGTFWIREEKEYCDFRVLYSPDGQKTEIKSAGYTGTPYAGNVPRSVVLLAALFLDTEK